MDLQGRSAIVTGGAGGLGEATVRHLVDLGVKVAVFDRAGDRAETLASELGAGAVGVGGDVNDDDDVTAAIDAASELGPLSIVVNVAGGATGSWRTLSRDGTPHDKQGFIDTMAMNAFGTFNVTRLAAARIAQNEPDDDGQRGVVVNTGSIAGIEGQTGQLAYGAAKAAILGMTLPLARDLAPVGIRVCGIAPGTMGTPLMMMAPDSLKEKLVSSIINPKRMGHPHEFALLVASIASNPYLNGENIRLDGALRFPPK
jgi:3-hydroxyacyl-CoA dehydrogenase/3-hydroxy-2-methylbutyryl-CoA dehydrogenase